MFFVGDFMNFSDYLKTFSTRDSPEGDLARDFIKSKSKAKTYLGILSNMQKNNADTTAVQILDRIYLQYKNR